MVFGTLILNIYPQRLLMTFAFCIVVSCAHTNQLVIKNKENIPSVLEFGEVEFFLPTESDVQFTPLYGASWFLSGDVTSLAASALFDSERNLNSLAQIYGHHEIRLKNVIVKFGNSGTDGTHTYPYISLEMEMHMRGNGSVDQICPIAPVHPEREKPVYHGLFADWEKKARLLLPAYEELIVEGFSMAFRNGLDCITKSNYQR